MAAIMRLGEEAAASGNLLDFGGLMPSAAGARVTLAGGDLAVTDGPFAESKEVISYALYDVQTREEAVEWSSRFLKLHRDLVARLGRRGGRAAGVRLSGSADREDRWRDRHRSPRRGRGGLADRVGPADRRAGPARA